MTSNIVVNKIFGKNEKHIPLDNLNFQKMHCVNKGHPEQK